MAVSPSSAEGQALTFRVGGELLALPAQEISEVIRRPSMTRVPLTPSSLLGLANLRGAVIPVVSVAALLGQQDDAAGKGRVIILDRRAKLGLLVDQVSKLVEVDQLHAGDRAIHLLDTERLIAGDFGAVARRTIASGGSTPKAPETEAQIDRDVALLAFTVKGQGYALPLSHVQEVLPLPANIAVMPHADAAMSGVVGHRDRLLPLLSLRVLLGGEAEDMIQPRGRVIVAHLGGTTVGLIVDAVRKILRVSAAAIDPVPPVLNRGKGETRIQAICRLDHGRDLVSILSADHLLCDDLAARLRRDADGANTVADMSDERETTEQFVVFQLGGEDFGLPIACVEEVIRVPGTLTRLPNAPAFVEGIMNLRGKVLPVIDQRRRFQADATGGRRRRIIVVRIGDMHAGFVVDGVSNVLRVPQSRLRGTPEFGGDFMRVIDRVATSGGDGTLVLLIDPQALLDRAEQDLLAAMRDGGADSATP